MNRLRAPDWLSWRRWSFKIGNATSGQTWHLLASKSRCPLIRSLRQYLQTIIAPSISRGPDIFYLGSSGNRRLIFSTKRSWKILRLAGPKLPWTRTVWFKCEVPKYSFTFWTAYLNRLPVKSRLLNWDLNIYPLCCLCNLHLETRDHLFLHCEFSEQVWNLVLPRLGLPSLTFVDWHTMIT